MIMRNIFGVKIRKCCASCDARLITSKGNCRFCALESKEVEAYDKCSNWQLSKGLEEAGSGKGGVKRKAYFSYLQEVRDREAIARGLGLRIPAKSIEEVRAEFEKENNSIFIDL